MPRTNNLLHTLQSLPEGAKRLVAGLGMIFGLILVGVGWSLVLPARLNVPSEGAIEPISPPDAPRESRLAPTPVQGLAESLKGLESFLPENLRNGRRDMTRNVWDQVGGAVRNGVVIASRAVERVWIYGYQKLH